MSERRPRSSTCIPGLRALAACGDGFWEINLLEGSAWFSEWFYRKLGWPLETKRAAVNDLKAALDPAQWESFMRRFREHLEQGIPFDPRLSVKCADGKLECWQLRGRAERTDGGLPIHVAGNARELSEGEAAAVCPCGAFEALPIAAAVLDTRGEVLHTNACWRGLGPCANSLAEQIQNAGNGTESLELTVAPNGAAHVRVGREADGAMQLLTPRAKTAARAQTKRALAGRAKRHGPRGTHRWVAVLKDR